MRCDKVSSFNLNPWVLAASVSLVILFAQVVVFQQMRISALQIDNGIHQQARKLEGETIRDLMYEMEQLRNAGDYQHQRGYVSGVVDTVNRPDYYSSIWHSGYSRGTEVQKYADALEQKETQYTKDAEQKKE